MAKILSKTGIENASTIREGHVSQSIDALSGLEAYDITISGSLTVNGPTNLNGLVTGTTFTGSFTGDGSGLTGIPLADLTDLNNFTSSANARLNVLELESGSIRNDFNTFTSSYNTGSFTGSFIGDGSQLTGIINVISSSFASTASYVDLVAGPNITINQVGTSFEISGSSGGGGGNTTQTTGLTISFTSKEIYNTPTSPGTGNISDDLTGAQLGIIQKIYHNSGSAPTVPAGWVLLGDGTYFTSQLNIIYAE